MNETVLTAAGLTKCYHGNPALDHLTLELPKGRIIGLLGPNGSGKTTFIKLAAGVLTPNSGSIAIEGRPVGPETKALVSYLPDRPYFSKNMRVQEQLDFFLNYVKEPMVQEFITGTEYSVDVFCDFDSRPITIVPRIRLAVRGGEIAKGVIVKDRDIINDVTRLLEKLKPSGHITVQCMKTDKGVQYIEINPRFGGGAPMSIDAGADSCANLYRLLSGEALDYNEDYTDGLTFVRFDSSIMLDENMERMV